MKFLIPLVCIIALGKADLPSRYGIPTHDDDDCRPDCTVVRCAGPPTNCPFGVGIPPCGCCPVCLENPDQNTCGGPNDSAGSCPNGLACLDDTCSDVRANPPFVPRPVGKCFVPCDVATGDEVCQPNCAAVSCAIPVGCQYGTVVPPCGCCPICAEGPKGTLCGGRSNRRCPNGLDCLDDMCQNIRNRPPFLPPLEGQCFIPCDRATGREVCVPDCSRVLCARPEGCTSGTVVPPCECCPVCADDNDGYCPEKKDCSKAFCIQVFCEYGSVTPPCECCPICLKGPGMPCAGPFNRDGNCGNDLVCVDAQLNPIPLENRGPNTPFGECERQRGNGCTRICPAFCPPFDPKQCEYGVDSDPCACCGRCARGLTESCGGPGNRLGSCARGLECIGINGDIIPYDGGPGTRSGRCRRRRTSNSSSSRIGNARLVSAFRTFPRRGYGPNY